MRKTNSTYYILLALLALMPVADTAAQTTVSAKIDARQITVGDQVRLFIEAKPDKTERLIWAVLPDTFNKLEIVEKGKIDTVQQNGITLYKQRLLVTGWDSGMFTIPAFEFTAVPKTGEPYKITTDSFALMVQTLPVDTAQAFKPIADIIAVKLTWRDYIWYVLSALLVIGLIIFLIYYFKNHKAVKPPAYVPPPYVETPGEKALRLLTELEQQQLWQNDKVKEYYTQMTDILRNYIEERFRTPAMELTTDELLMVASRHKDMIRQTDALATILQTADMAKFAKAQPLPQEHVDTFELTKLFVLGTKPVVTENTDKQ